MINYQYEFIMTVADMRLLAWFFLAVSKLAAFTLASATCGA
ncbi:MAG: hypothetical protein PHU14_10350 [Methylovulum sp.]|nr:hypothetical protein [Methylovulum sp.]